METALDVAARNASKARTVCALALASNLRQPLVYADVGALWGVDNPLVQQLRNNKRLRIVGFDPDEAECARLRAANPDDIYLPIGVGDMDGQRRFYVTAFSPSSSFLEPALEAFHGLPHAELFKVASTPEIPMRRIDSLVAEGAIPMPDFVKIDVQGFELNVLQGFGELIGRVLGFRLETQLRPLYKTQALLPDICGFMRSRGFILRDLRITYPFEYEIVEVEAYFSCDPRMARERFQELKIWEILHDIPPGRTIAFRNGKIEWNTLPM